MIAFPPQIVLFHPNGTALEVLPAGGAGGTGDCSQRGYRVAAFPTTNPLAGMGFAPFEGGRDGGGTWRLRLIDSFASGGMALLDAALFIVRE